MALVEFRNNQAPYINAENLNNNFNELNNKVDEYSTSEIKTNKVWIDGKPIYRKVIQGSAANTDNLSLSNIITFNEIIDMRFRYKTDTTNVYYDNYSRAGVEQQIFLGENETALIFRGTNNFSEYTITLEYTKTTDEVEE